MPNTPSPLRYPGGKTSLWSMIANIIVTNALGQCHYVEPYAGGSGLALSLLFKGFVNELHLNDIDRSIYCFWQAILHNTDEFITKLKKTPITMDEWYKQRLIQCNKSNVDDFDLAFSSFFLNRTNRSGILNAGMIGGYAQDGAYTLDCRFNKERLIEKIKQIQNLKDNIHFYNMDAIDFINKTCSNIPQHNIFYCIDPPYFGKGKTLYTNAYAPDDHAKLAKLLIKLNVPWVLTYDDVPEIKNLYRNKRQYHFNLNYSAAHKRVGTELLIASDNLALTGQLKLSKAA